jgi:hypothetical protein
MLAYGGRGFAVVAVPHFHLTLISVGSIGHRLRQQGRLLCVALVFRAEPFFPDFLRFPFSTVQHWFGFYVSSKLSIANKTFNR